MDHPVVADLAGTLLALCLWPVFAALPGLILVRRGGLPAVAALPLSFAVVPILAYLPARFAALEAAIAIALVVAAAALPATRAVMRPPRWAVVAALVWAVVAYASMADLVRGETLALPGLANDYAKHVAVADAVARTGVPPVNPSFHPGLPLPLFYYHLWFMLAGAVDLLGGPLVDARHAVMAGTIWTGWALMASVACAARLLKHVLPPPPSPAGWAPTALLLLTVTGLDIVPFLVVRTTQTALGVGSAWVPDLEWWNEQITAWATAMLWVPHHVAALVAALTGLAVLRRRPDAAGIAVGAPAFASAFGMSVWVALVAAAIAAAWTATALLRRGRREAVAFLLAGVGSLVLAAPLMLDLAAARLDEAAPLVFAVREFFPLTRSDAMFGVEWPCGSWCRLAALPLNYMLEFGFFALAAMVYWRWRCSRGRLADDEMLLIVIAGVSVFATSFLRADIAANDLGWRGMMFAQFVLLLWAAPVLAALRRHGEGPGAGWRRGLMLALALGVLASLTQTMAQRMRPLRAENWDMRRTQEWIAANLAADAVPQHNPAVVFEPFHALYGHRQVAVSDRLYAGLYGVPTERVEAAMRPLARLFHQPLPAAEAAREARRLGVTHLVAQATDPAWHDRDGWVWTGEPLYATRTTRVVAVPAD